MAVWIFIDVNNPGMIKDQEWSDAQRDAVYRAMCRNEGKDLNQLHSDIQEYVDQWCMGERLDYRFEHGRGEKLPIESTVASAKKLYDFLKQECEEVGLMVNWRDGVI